ncbi:MAG TPA: RNA polymerase sigma factor [Polyangiaceae bacterium]|nr:RNA polymerase sigma factor [Polyangiaceae bacterium]
MSKAARSHRFAASPERLSQQSTFRLSVLANLFRDHRLSLQTAAFKLTQDRAEASDLMQDAAERALRCAPLVSEEDLLRWVCAVMRNLAVDRFRQQRARSRALVSLRVLEWMQLQSSQLPDAETTPEADWVEFSAEDIARATQQLSAPFRRVFELSRELPLTHVAAQLGLPPATVGTRLFRARRKLRELLRRNSSSESPGSAPRRCA